MDRVDEAVRQLKDYRCMVTAWQNLKHELMLLKPGSEEYERCQQALLRTRHRVLSVEQAMAALPPAQEVVLSMLYLDKKERTAPLIADTLGLSLSSLYRRRKSALEKFSLAYFGDGR